MTSSNLNVKRIALVIQYVGTNFHGWQRQPHHRSVQEDIETAIALTVGHDVTIHGAGRTDSGVHGAAQVAHFDVASSIPPERWAKVLNTRLGDDVFIRASAEVAPPLARLFFRLSSSLSLYYIYWESSQFILKTLYLALLSSPFKCGNHGRGITTFVRDS